MDDDSNYWIDDDSKSTNFMTLFNYEDDFYPEEKSHLNESKLLDEPKVIQDRMHTCTICNIIYDCNELCSKCLKFICPFHSVMYYFDPETHNYNVLICLSCITPKIDYYMKRQLKEEPP